MRTTAKSASWEDVIGLWEHARPQSTLSVYRPVVTHFLNFIQRIPPQELELRHLQAYEDLFKKQRPNTRKRKVATVKSLVSFAHRVGAIPSDPGRMLRCPHVPDDLAERILPKKDVIRMIDLEPDAQNSVVLMLLFSAGVRAAEAAGIRWLDCRSRGAREGQVTVLGKGQKKRTIRLEPEVWQALMKLKPDNAALDDFVFLSRNGWKQPLSRTRIANIVRQAAKRAGIERPVSPHWMRHAHATVAMDAGCPITLIQATLGHTSIQTTSRYIHVSPEASSSSFIRLRETGRKKKVPVLKEEDSGPNE